MMSSLPKLDLNFGARHRHLPPLGVALLAAGAGAALYAVLLLSSAFQARETEQDAYDALIVRMHSIRHSSEAAARITPAEAEKLRNASLIANELNTPWNLLLGALEAAPMEHVALLSVEPIAPGRQLRLIGEAKNLSAMLDYLSYLQSKPELQRVILTSHQIQNQPGSPVRFHIQARWGNQ